MFMSLFGERLKELRKESGLSTMALGKIIGVSDITISRWENGKMDIVSDNLIKLAKYFEVTTDYLLGLKDI